jgi:hypothetical protein
MSYDDGRTLPLEERYRIQAAKGYYNTTKADLVTEEHLRQLDATPADFQCSECNRPLKTEGEFARHFYVPDVQYVNLGSCPDGRGSK